jgi:hypothetical protein
VDFFLPLSRLTDSYSVKTANFEKELALEVYRVIPLPAECKGVPALRVAAARSGEEDVATGTPQLVVEDTPRGKFLHIRVPLKVRGVDTARVVGIARKGLTVDLEGRP